MTTTTNIANAIISVIVSYVDIQASPPFERILPPFVGMGQPYPATAYSYIFYHIKHVIASIN